MHIKFPFTTSGTHGREKKQDILLKLQLARTYTSYLQLHQSPPIRVPHCSQLKAAGLPGVDRWRRLMMMR